MVALLYYVVVNCLTNGRSLGKWIAHTRIMSLSHQRVGLWQSIERVLGYAAATAEGLGFLQYFWSHNRMCVQDRIAETIVVDVRKIAKHQPTSDNLVS